MDQVGASSGTRESRPVVVRVLMTGSRVVPLLPRKSLRSALLRWQSSPRYARLAKKLPIAVEVVPATGQDLRLVKDLRVERDPPLRPGLSNHIVGKVFGLPCGYLWMGTNPPHEQPCRGCWIARVRVHPLFRRLGVAEALVTTAVSDARKQGFSEVFALVENENPAAQGLYRKLRFERISTGPGETASELEGRWAMWRLGLTAAPSRGHGRPGSRDGGDADLGLQQNVART
jgi:ribosomal protein S18 acetylase RimI-like enzyme